MFQSMGLDPSSQRESARAARLLLDAARSKQKEEEEIFSEEVRNAGKAEPEEPAAEVQQTVAVPGQKRQ